MLLKYVLQCDKLESKLVTDHNMSCGAAEAKPAVKAALKKKRFEAGPTPSPGHAQSKRLRTADCPGQQKLNFRVLAAS